MQDGVPTVIHAHAGRRKVTEEPIAGFTAPIAAAALGLQAYLADSFGLGGRPEWIGTTAILAAGLMHGLRLRTGVVLQNTAVGLKLAVIGGFVLIFILLALSMFGFYELQLPGRLQTRLAEASNRQQGGQLAGVAVMGFLSALIVGPCVAPPLMAALIVIGSSGDAVLGGAALFSLSMGMGVPLILFGVSAGKFVPRAGAWMEAVKAVFGVGLLGLSIWMLERILPGGVIMALWGVLALSCGVYEKRVRWKPSPAR